MVTPYSEEFIHMTPESENRLRELRDEFGDSYVVNVSDSRLRDLLKSMNPRPLLSSHDLASMEGELRGVLDSQYRIFSGCVFYSMHPRVSKSHCELLMERVRLLGGRVASTFSCCCCCCCCSYHYSQFQHQVPSWIPL